MKTLHISIISGIILFCLGIVLLSTSYYLQQPNPANFPHCMVSGKAIACCCPPDEPYYYSYLDPMTYIGIAGCCIGIILILYKTLSFRFYSKLK